MTPLHKLSLGLFCSRQSASVQFLQKRANLAQNVDEFVHVNFQLVCLEVIVYRKPFWLTCDWLLLNQHQTHWLATNDLSALTAFSSFLAGPWCPKDGKSNLLPRRLALKRLVVP